MALLFTLPRSNQFDAVGQLMSGWTVEFYTTNTSVPRTVYADAALTSAIGTSVTTGDDGSLRPIYLDDEDTAYKVIIKDQNGEIVPNGTIDPYLLGPSQAQLGRTLYPRTESERTALVIPTSSDPPGHALRYGSTNDAARLQDAINSGHAVFIPDGTYILGTTTLTLRSNLIVDGESREGTVITYSGTGIAVDGYGDNFVQLSHFTVQTTNVAATAMRFGNGVQQIGLTDVRLAGDTSASNTGIGLLLQAGSPGSFSGNFSAYMMYTLGYKYGISFVGTDTSVNTWTTCSFWDCYLIGRAAGVISGSVGISMDANTNGVGSLFRGGTIESFATGFLHTNGAECFGMDVEADMEGNTADYTVGASFRGKIRTPVAGNYLHAGANGTTNKWYRERQFNGDYIREQYRTHKYVTENATGDGVIFGIFRGTSLIDGGTPEEKFAVYASDSGEQDPLRNHVKILGNMVGWASAMPSTGTFAAGSFIFNSAPSKDGNNMAILGWHRLTTGSGHVSGTDWMVCRVSHVSPATSAKNAQKLLFNLSQHGPS